MEPSGRVYTPGQAAQVLEVTTQTLRRYADDYGEVFGPVIQRGRQRMFDDIFINRLGQAQVLQQTNAAPSIRVALEFIRDRTPAGEAIAHPDQPPFEQTVLEKLNALAEMVTHLSAENRALHRRLNQLEAPRDDQSPELEGQRRMNAYLMGELQRRSETEQLPSRGWWTRVFGQRRR